MKSILLIDTPENCAECPLRYWGIGGWSCICTRRLLEGPIAEREEWCPLKPLPIKKMPKQGKAFPQDMRLIDRWRGWDACIDEIMGETE